MRRMHGFTIAEMLVVTLVIGLVIATLMKILTGTFAGAKKGFDTLTLLQENSKLIAALKQDLRTLIIGGPDNIPSPIGNPMDPGITGNTNTLEFFKVWNIDESGRPLVVKITYTRDGSPSGKPFGITRSTGIGPGSEPPKKFVPDLLTKFQISLLDNQGVAISNSAQSNQVKKFRLSLTSHGTDLLSTAVSIYSPYVPASGTSSIYDLWVRNYTCVDFQPGAGVRVCGMGIIQGTAMTALGVPLVLNGETPLFQAP
ncbi:MAG: type II secretion system protein [Candidatus Ozemobacteraceae bacterium]